MTGKRRLVFRWQLEEDRSMKTIVGVDQQGYYKSALDLLARLNFADSELHLAHVEPTMSTYGLMPMAPVFTPPMMIEQADVAATISEMGHKLLVAAAADAKADGLGDAHTIYTVGNSSQTLMRFADELPAQLIAIGARPHGVLESFFLGSVGRALAINAHQSFAIARRIHKERGPLHVVFATDHSPYANRCFDRLLAMQPKGVSRISILTVFESGVNWAQVGQTGFEPEIPPSLEEIEDGITLRGESLVRKVIESGREADFHLVEGFAPEVIRETIKTVDADLLVIGARGHGLIERVLIGSLALHVVVSEQYPVLVIRVPE